MNNNKYSLILGIISIISTLLFVGIPTGTNILEILNTLIFILGILLILYINIIKKKNNLSIVIIYFIITFILTTYIELNHKNYTLLSIGFIPGLVLSIIGLNKSKTKPSIIINIIALILSLLSLLITILNGNLIIK